MDTNPWKSRQGLFTVKQPETGKSETAGSSFAKSAVEIQLANNACSETADKGNIPYSDFLTPMSLSLSEDESCVPSTPPSVMKNS